MMSKKRSLILMATLAVFISPVGVSYAEAPSETKTKIESEKPEEQRSYLDIQTVTSQSGISAWLVEDHSIPVISISYAFEGAGAKNDPADKQGLARLASNTMDEGSSHLDSLTFQKMLRDYSISLSFSASRDHFTGKLKTLTRNKDIAFDLLKNALLSPRFDDDAVQRMRASNQSRIKASSTDPNWIAARIQNDVIFEGHPYALNSGGTISSLESITKQDLQNFHKTLGKNNLVIGVTGDITAEELAIMLDDVFGEMPVVEDENSDDLSLQNQGKTYLYEKEIPQTVIEIAQKGVRQSDEDYYAAKVMNFILGESGFGSRLMEEIREKRGLTYGIYSYYREYEDTTVFHISTSTANENVSEMLELINAEIDKIKTAPVETTELKEAKSYLIGSLPLSLTSTDSVSSILLSMQMDDLPRDYLDTRAQSIEAVSEEDIQAAAERIFDEESFTTILVGMPEGMDNLEKVTKLPNVE